MSPRRLASAFLVATSLAVAATARAEAPDVEEARRLFIEGARLAHKGSWAEARDHYERSLQRKRAAITLYSLGVAQRQTGALVEAQDTFRAFLAEPATPATQSYELPARQALDELEHEVGHLRVVLVAAGPAPVVALDGRPLPRTALGAPLAVNPGPHRVRAASAPGGEVAVDIVVGAGATQEVALRLVGPASSAPSPAAAAPPPAPLLPRVLPFALMGAGAVTLGAGIAIGLVGVSQAHASPTRDGAEADAARTKALVGDVVGGVGVAAIAAGVGVLLFAPRASRTARLAPWVAGSSAGLAGWF